MKRFMTCFICILSLTLLLTGCKVTTPADGDAWDQVWSDLEQDLKENVPDWTKHHYYQVLDGEDQELYTITDEEQIEALDDLLGNAGDGREENPTGGDIACTYVYWQEKTLLAGQDPDAEREYEEVMRFTIYQDQDLMTMRILDGLQDFRLLDGVDLEGLLTITASVPAETMEALRDPAQFAK